MKRLSGLTAARHTLATAAAIGAIAAVTAVTGSGCAADPDAGNANIVVLPDDLIDNLESGDDRILALGFRDGFWYGFNDNTAGALQSPDPNHFLPTMGGVMGSNYSAWTGGRGFILWGAGMGFDLNNPGDPVGGPANRGVYDASAFKGVTFSAKGNMPVRVAIATEAVVDILYKGTCVPDPGLLRTCDDTHGKQVSTSPEWRKYVIPFDSMRQEGFGKIAPLDLHRAMAIHFSVSQNSNFDYQVDDIGFYR